MTTATTPTPYFLDQLFRHPETVLFGTSDVFLAMFVTTLLCFMLSHVYRETHRGTSYSQSFLTSLFIMGVATSVVMMIIGSNIARAFSLVGALSIIRFRTAVKDTRDTAFLFCAMIAGMGCGTQFYLPAIALTVFISVLILGLHYFDYGIKKKLEGIVRITFKDSKDVQARVEAELEQTFKGYDIINRILDFGDGYVTNVYVTRPHRTTDLRAFEKRLSSLDGVKRLAFYQTDQHAPL